MNFFNYLRDELNISLNEQQKEAIEADNKRILLEACPGSGKTTTLVARIAYLILYKKAKPSDILTLTFSRASAQDMERRFKSLFGNILKQPVHFSTIHSFCYQFLFFCQRNSILAVPELLERQENNGKHKILRNVYFGLHNEYLSEDEVDNLSNDISFVKNKIISPEQYKTVFNKFSLLYQKYEEYKQSRNLMDFDDMLSMTYRILKEHENLLNGYGRFTCVHVDEVQDTSLIQHKIIKILSQNGNLFMVGDTDQSIYGFRGAEPEYIVNIQKIFPDARILRLEVNYRSTESIVRLSSHFISQNTFRHAKDMRTYNCDGEIPRIYLLENKKEQIQKAMELIDQESGKNTAILFRNNLSGLPVAYNMIIEGVPFYIRENYSSFFKHFVISDIFSFFKLAIDSTDMESFSKIYYKIGASISKEDLQNLKARKGEENIFSGLFSLNRNKRYMTEHINRIKKAFEKIRNSVPEKALDIIEQELGYGDFLRRNTGCMNIFTTLKYFAEDAKSLPEFKTRLRTLKNGIDQSYRRYNTAGVNLLTLHGSKGMEFDRVVIIDLIDGQFPSEKSVEGLITGNRKEYEEEVRLFYVGVTRAKKEVYLIAPCKCEGKTVIPSRFIDQFLNGYREVLGEGQIVLHKRFGEGVVKGCSGDVAEIMFKKQGCRKLSVKNCMKAGLLKIN